MNLLFASDRQLEMMQLKRRKLNAILLYNKQQIQRKSQEKYNQNQQKQQSYRMVNMHMLEALSDQKNIKAKKKQIERNQLRESYQRQIREKEEKIIQQKLKERQLYNRQKAYSDVEELRRMVDIKKMFDRQTFIATPLISPKKNKTQSFQQHKQFHNADPSPFYLPNINQRNYETSQHKKYQLIIESKKGSSDKQKNLDNIQVHTFRPNSFITRK